MPTQNPCLFDPWNPCANIKEYRKLCKPVTPVCEHIRQAILKPGDVEFYVMMDSNCYRSGSSCIKPEASQLRIIARWEAPVSRSNSKYKKLTYRLKSLEDTVYFRDDSQERGVSIEQAGELYVLPAYNKVDQARCKVKSVDVIKKSDAALQRVAVSVKVRAWRDEGTKGGKSQELILEVAVPPEPSKLKSETGMSPEESQVPISVAPPGLKALISYAREDVEFKRKLVRYFGSLKDSGLVSVWHDNEILAGQEWRDEIEKQLNDTQIILLLISLDFLDSPFIKEVELKRALERYDVGEATVIPIIVRECDWKEYPAIAKLQALPASGKAKSEYPDEDKWFTEVKNGLRKVIKELMDQQHSIYK
jgi:hypothetical protein